MNILYHILLIFILFYYILSIIKNLYIRIIFVIIIYISIIYIYSYFINDNNIEIYQTDLNDFRIDLLYYKQPIIIQDKIVDPNDLIKLWFNLNLISKKNTRTQQWNTNNNKYMITYAKTDTSIFLCNPSTIQIKNKPDSKAQPIEISLKENQILIIPFRWIYFIEGDGIDTIMVNDMITSVYSIMKK